MPTLQATSSDALQQLVACSRELYSLPRVAMQVLELTEQQRVDIPALRACLEHDPALASKVLRVVNSSLFGLPRQVADLNHALTLLGVKPLKMLVLGFSLPPALMQDLEAEVLQQYWRRTIIKAVAAREIAQRWGTVDGEEMLIAGLLQDIGVLVMLQQLGEPYSRFVKHAWESGNQLCLLERSLFGFDHAEITARLLDSWRLPKPLVAAVRLPDTLAANSPQTTTILWLAELVASFLGSGDPELLAALYQSMATWKQVSAERVDLLLIELQVQVEQLAEIYLPRPGEQEDYAALVGQARQRMGEHSQSLADCMTIETRDVSINRDQWLELLKALETLPTDHESQLPEFSGAEADQTLPRSTARLPVLPPEIGLPSMPPAQSSYALHDSPAGDPVLLRRVAQSASYCRSQRVGLSLLLVELDKAHDTLLKRGVSFFSQLREESESLVNGWHYLQTEAMPQGDSGFALLLADTERLAAARLGRRLLDAISRSTPHGLHYCGTSLSMGVATICLPPKNFEPADLVSAAQRCLRGAQLSGGACLKSIEIY
jgi:HD-like signal output (HDOD) protein